MLVPSTKARQRDWYVADSNIARQLWVEQTIPTEDGEMQTIATMIPGASRISGSNSWQVHRTHLPIIDAPEAFKIVSETKRSDWAARDRITDSLGFRLRVTQQQALDYIEPRRGILLGDDMRLGKGHPAGTCMMTPNGWVPIEMLNVHSQVIGSNGRACNVTGVYRRGVLPTYRVTFSDGASVVVDGDHLWHVWNHNGWHRGGKPRVIETRKLIGDLTYGSHGNRKWRIPMVAPVEFETKNLRLDPYVLGVILGDGSIAGGSVTICTGDDLVPAEVGRLLPTGSEIRRRKAYSGKATVWGLSRIDDHDNPVTQELRALGLMGLTSEKKFVPATYAFGSVAQRLALLQGLMDTDGELHKGVACFSSSSKALADSVKFLVESLGGSAREGYRAEPHYKYKGELRTGLPSHRLTIAMPPGISPFRVRPGYVDRPKFQPARTIASIEPCGEAEVICISVDAEDQLYVTENFIVTHNTISAAMAHDQARGPLVVVAPLSTRGVWVGWLTRVFPETPIAVLIGKKIDKELLKKPIIFVHYDIIRHWQVSMPIGTLILDEAHALTNKDALRSKAVVFLASRAEKVIATTGTPIWDRPKDLWNLVGILNPGAWGSYYEFGRRYGAPVETAYGVDFPGLSNKEELQARLSEVMIRRLWKDVSDDLPPISRNIVVAEVDDKTRRKLDIVAASLRSEKTNTIGNLAAYRKQVCNVKLKTVIREVEKLRANGEPVVVWTWHKEFAVAIESTLDLDGVPVWRIDGDVTAIKREAAIGTWNECPNGVLVATMSVAREGIDLSHSHLPVFAELDYVPAIIGQTEMRTFDPKRPMNVTYVVADHMVDQRIIRALISKLGSSDPLGLGAAIDAIDAIRLAINGPNEDPDLVRFVDDLLASEAACG